MEMQQTALAECSTTLGFAKEWKKGSSALPATRETVKTLVPRIPESVHESPVILHVAPANPQPRQVSPTSTGPVKTLLVLATGTYPVETLPEYYSDDVSKQIHSVTTAVVAVSPARHHTRNWKDYPVGPSDGAF